MATIQPGLERISQLLKDVPFPWKAIHVAGTNGKGSVCHYAASLLRSKRIKCGKFTSPHLVDRWDCIHIDGKPVHDQRFKKIENHYIKRNLDENINASPFEILTATAFHLFNAHRVEIGVVEVGMGGKLDATNILQNQVVSVITKIARDHEGFLGNTLEDIAIHKAGILRPDTPYIVNPSNLPHIQNVIDDYAKEISAGPRLTGDTSGLRPLYNMSGWLRFASNLRPFQKDNAVLGILAAREACWSLNLDFAPDHVSFFLAEIKKQPIPGRCEKVRVQAVFGNGKDVGRPILVDGAHNPDAAIALDQHVNEGLRHKTIEEQLPPKRGWPVTWVLAMTEGKDAQQYLQHLLRPGDNVVTASFGPVDGMPWVKPMDPKELLRIATSVEPGIFGVHIDAAEPLRALCAAKHLTVGEQPIVLTGSLYLVGDFYRELRSRSHPQYFTEQKSEQDREMFRRILEEEDLRVKQALSRASVENADASASIQMHMTEEQRRRQQEREKREQMLSEIRTLDEELRRLEDAELAIPTLGATYAQLPVASKDHADGSMLQDDTSEQTSASSLSQQYGKILDEIRVKLHALRTSAGVTPTVAVDVEEDETQDETSVDAEGTTEQDEENLEQSSALDTTSQDSDEKKEPKIV